MCIRPTWSVVSIAKQIIANETSRLENYNGTYKTPNSYYSDTQQGKAARDYPGGLSKTKASLIGWQKRISVL
jgi:hypothetical protein